MTEPLQPCDIFPECQPVLEVQDVQAAIDWYQERLGFELEFTVDDPPTYACLGRSFSNRGAPACIRFVAWYRDRDQLLNSGWLSIYVGRGIDELYTEYQNRNVPVHSEIANYEYGMREFEIRDCNGHYLRFGCTLDELG